MLVAALALAVLVPFAASQSFTIANDQFILNGKPILLMSGCVHYSRVRPEDWPDRLARIAALGANAVETYVPWNYHETNQGTLRLRLLGRFPYECTRKPLFVFVFLQEQGSLAQVCLTSPATAILLRSCWLQRMQTY